MHQWKINNELGFTLIEMIAALVILGILAIALSSAIMYGVQNLSSARDAAQISQKAQLALARINRELINISAVSSATATQIDYTLPQSIVPSCTLSAGCQYSMKKTGTQITLEGTNPVVAAQILIDGLDAANGGNSFLTYFQADGTTPWTTANPINQLARINITIVINLIGSGQLHQNQLLTFPTTVNPRLNGVQNAPSLI